MTLTPEELRERKRKRDAMKRGVYSDAEEKLRADLNAQVHVYTKAELAKFAKERGVKVSKAKPIENANVVQRKQGKKR